MAEITGTNGDDVLNGTGDPEVICGLAGNDRLFGRGGSDFLDGGPGADLLDGGDTGPHGNIAIYRSARTGVHATLRNPSENTGDAAGDTYINIQGLEGSDFADILHGNSHDNDLFGGGGGDDILDGGGGGDRLFGGTRFDSASYKFALTGIVASLADPSHNTGEADGDAYFSIEALLGSNFNDRLTGDDDENFLAGNGGDDQLRGGAGNDRLDGGVGSNLLEGGIGVDTVDYSTASSAIFVLLEQAFGGGGGRSDVYTGIENIIGSAFDDELLGDSFDNDIRGGLGNDRLEGGFGADLLDGGSGADDLDGGDGSDQIDGDSGVDHLDGGDGSDQMDGGDGADTMIGGTGDDFYRVDDIHDRIFEVAGEGTDTVASSVTYVLTAGAAVEMLRTTLPGRTGFINLTGNAFDQTIVGNFGINVLRGGGGKDTLHGLGGDDTYFVDSADDVVVEVALEGEADLVATSADYVLGAGVDVEILRTTANGGTSAIDLTGNALQQTIIGNAGANILHDGGVGAADTMTGLDGNDTYRVFNSEDVIVEVAGAAAGSADRVVAAVDYRLGAGVHVEIMTTNGSAGTSAIDLTGNEFGQRIIGNSGDNRLEGRGGLDVLSGLGGKDTFVFATALGAGNIDIVTDFNVADDRFLLSDAVFTELATGTLSAAAFRANTTGLAGDANDRIIYEKDTGRLFYDPDGTGGAAGIHFATITAGLALTNADFSVA
ncbi:calcium-binding protein [Mesorhizobium sp. LHD-90]|uniref:calcium-binding protein n=1 Tax=Mesorhizobium sp. LHD-90 TaxID=3071414 RepID=UPI0027DF7F5E|nr:calcium-binding protein [Mesorhizobium sp. LHD-90]MDQ6433936.1 calcium-binding protein [Mesorhizobium sp. LHD-90]